MTKINSRKNFSRERNRHASLIKRLEVHPRPDLGNMTEGQVSRFHRFGEFIGDVSLMASYT